jgi:hypothetical protein
MFPTQRLSRVLALSCTAVAFTPAAASARVSWPYGQGAGTAPDQTASIITSQAAPAPCPPPTHAVRGPGGAVCASRTDASDLTVLLVTLSAAGALVGLGKVVATARRSQRLPGEFPLTQA